MNTKLKGSALVAAVGMVFALGVTAPANAATTDRPQNVTVSNGYDYAIVSFDVPSTTVAIDLVYKTYTNGGGSSATPVSFYAPELPPATIETGHKSFVIPADKILGGRLEVATLTGDPNAPTYNWDISWYRIGTNTNAPQDFTANITGGDQSLTFSLNSLSAGTPTPTYEYSTDGGTTWKAVDNCADPTVNPWDGTGTCTVTVDSSNNPLVNGKDPAYTVHLRGTNTIGGNLYYSRPTAGLDVNLAGVPTAPEISLVGVGNGSATVHVDIASERNGSDVTGYEFSTDGGATWRAAGLPDVDGNITVRGLKAFVTVSVWLRGRNAVGASDPSNEVTNVTPTGVSCSTITAPTVKFKVSKWTLTASAKASLNAYAAAIAQSDCASITLQGHRVIVKSKATNRARLRLGNHRIAAVKAYLEAQGVALPITGSVVKSKDNRRVVILQG